MEEINFDSSELINKEIQNPKKSKRFRKFRNWYNNLSKNQKYIFYLSIIIGMLCIIVDWPPFGGHFLRPTDIRFSHVERRKH